MVRVRRGLVGSFDRTVIVFAIGPWKSIVSSSAWTLPLAPGAIFLSKEATVQPQAGRTSLISRSAWPWFSITKSTVTFWPFDTVPASWIGSAATRRGAGPAGTAGAGAAVAAAGAAGAAAGGACAKAVAAASAAKPYVKMAEFRCNMRSPPGVLGDPFAAGRARRAML